MNKDIQMWKEKTLPVKTRVEITVFSKVHFRNNCSVQKKKWERSIPSEAAVKIVR